MFGTNRPGEEVLGITTVPDAADLPDGSIDLVMVCTPASANLELLRTCAAKGARAAFVTSAGYGEAGDDGPRRRGRAGRRCATSSGSCSPGPTARASSARRPSCAPRSWRRTRRPGASASPARAATSCPASSTCARASGVGVSAGPCRPATPPRSPSPTTSTTTPTTRRPPSAWPTSRASATAGRCSTASARRPRRKPLVLAQGRGHRGRRARRGQPHRRAGGRRQGVRRRLPGRRHHAGADGRGGVRGGRHVRHPAAAARARTSSC